MNVNLCSGVGTGGGHGRQVPPNRYLKISKPFLNWHQKAFKLKISVATWWGEVCFRLSDGCILINFDHISFWNIKIFIVSWQTMKSFARYQTRVVLCVLRGRWRGLETSKWSICVHIRIRKYIPTRYVCVYVNVDIGLYVTRPIPKRRRKCKRICLFDYGSEVSCVSIDAWFEQGTVSHSSLKWVVDEEDK